MRLKANDTLHVSAVKADNILPGEEFDVSDDFARQLIEKGLATEMKGEKSAAPVENKMEDEPANKASKPRRGK